MENGMGEYTRETTMGGTEGAEREIRVGERQTTLFRRLEVSWAWDKVERLCSAEAAIRNEVNGTKRP